MWQAEHVRDGLRAVHPGLGVEILGLSTRGDQILDTSLAKIGGKGLFVKELEVALEAGRADLAVHSAKDVPMALADGLVLAAILPREDPRDAFVSNAYAETRRIASTVMPRPQCGSASQYPISAENRSTSAPGKNPIPPAASPSMTMANSIVGCAPATD